MFMYLDNYPYIFKKSNFKYTTDDLLPWLSFYHIYLTPWDGKIGSWEP